MSLTKGVDSNWISSSEVKKIHEVLQGQMRFVGGCVRNILLGMKVSDIDIATPFPPDKVIELFEASSIKVKPTGLEHGTVTVIINHKAFEITTLRKDVATDGRHAVVEFTDSYKEDAKRRDFTINAMSMDIESNIFDYFGGMEDLKNNKVRFVGDAEQRVKEDYLRILRFFRFLAIYGKAPADAEAILACKANIEQIRILAGERVRTELFKLLAADDPFYSLAEMQNIGLLQLIIGGNPDIESCRRLKSNSYILRLACLIGNLNLNKINSLTDTLKLSNSDAKKLHDFYKVSDSIKKDISMFELRKLIVKYGNENLTTIILYVMAKNNESGLEKILNLAQTTIIPQFIINGDDLISIGVSPGKKIGELLSLAMNYWLMHDCEPNKDELMQLVKKELF